jgi:hypothetical protein
MQALLTRRRSGCSASASSVEGSPFTVRRPPAQFGGSCEDSLAFALQGGYLSMQNDLAANEFKRDTTVKGRYC